MVRTVTSYGITRHLETGEPPSVSGDDFTNAMEEVMAAARKLEECTVDTFLAETKFNLHTISKAVSV